jgi:hypothetical protein
MEEMRNACKILVGKPERKSDSEDVGANGGNIRMDLSKMGWEGVDWIYLTQDRD